MKKKSLFKNYTYQFDKNERKILSTFCKQALQQVSGDQKYYAEARIYNSILDKLNRGTEEVKLTKEEKIRLVTQLRENIKYLDEKMKKSWFIKKWLYRSVYAQYNSILQNHFDE